MARISFFFCMLYSKLRIEREICFHKVVGTDGWYALVYNERNDAYIYTKIRKSKPGID